MLPGILCVIFLILLTCLLYHQGRKDTDAIELFSRRYHERLYDERRDDRRDDRRDERRDERRDDDDEPRYHKRHRKKRFSRKKGETTRKNVESAIDDFLKDGYDDNVVFRIKEVEHVPCEGSTKAPSCSKKPSCSPQPTLQPTPQPTRSCCPCPIPKRCSHTKQPTTSPSPQTRKPHKNNKNNNKKQNHHKSKSSHPRNNRENKQQHYSDDVNNVFLTQENIREPEYRESGILENAQDIASVLQDMKDIRILEKDIEERIIDGRYKNPFHGIETIAKLKKLYGDDFLGDVLKHYQK